MTGSGRRAGGRSTLVQPKAVSTEAATQIRDYLAIHKGAMPAEVVGALKQQGMKVSSQMVSTIKGKLKLRRRGRRKAVASSNGTGLTMENLLQAKKLVDEMGIERAKEAINALAKLA